MPGPFPQYGKWTVVMSNEKQVIREKLAQARRTLDDVNDPGARELVRADIEELEARLLSAMGATSI
jgi:hypothetical protein